MENPLESCPSSPNCARRSYQVSIESEMLYPLVLKTLQAMRARIKTQNKENCKIHAVFPVFLFKDDVKIVIESISDNTFLHIRSASRVGNYDLGVNKRRVDRFIRRLNKHL